MMTGKEGKCFGTWDIRDMACSKCLECVRVKCEESTKRKSASASEDEQEGEAGGGLEAFSANEHFLRLLECKLDRTVKWGEQVVESTFTRDNKLVAFAGYRRTDGKMKVCVGNGVIRKVVSLENVDQAEALAKEVLEAVGVK